MEDDSEESDEVEELDEVIDIDEDEDDVEETQPLLKQEIEDTIVDKAAEIVEEAIVEQKMFEYDLLLDPSVMNAIQESLASTPHEGFKPVVSVSPSGNLKIDFVPL